MTLRRQARRGSRQPVVRGGPVAPPVGGLLRGAISLGKGILSGDARSAAASLSRGLLPRGSLLGDLMTAIRQPMIRANAAAGGAHTAGLNIRSQLGLIERQRLHARRSAATTSASNNFLYGQRQTGRLTARRRGTPVPGGQPTYRP